METFNIYQNLAWLNELPADEAERLFFEISGSDRWARELTKQRPFLLLDRLYETAESVWFSLPVAERIEAFSQSENGVVPKNEAANGHRTEFERAVSLYREKFGFIFVLSGEGKSESEMTAVCKARLGNSAATELQIAAEEHRKLIELRLTEVLEK